MAMTVGALAELVGGQALGDLQRPIDGVADLASAGPRQVSFLTHVRYLAAFQQTRAGAVLLHQAIPDAPSPLILCADPYLALARVTERLYPQPTRRTGVETGAWVHPEASVDPSASVACGAVVEMGAQIGPRSQIGAGCVIGRQAVVGADCWLHPGVRVLQRCHLGDRVILHAGVVVGSDGFGFAADAQGKRHKIPHTGIVRIGDDVEIGANSTLDRATFGETVIGAGTKIDNLVQIAHNVVIGRDCIVAAQTGIAGSTRIGDGVVIGAQSGLAGHLQVASGVVLAGRTGVASSLKAPGIYSGTPAMPHRTWLKFACSKAALPELRRKVRQLEARLAKLSS